jgi:hypothetical protein
MREPEFRVQFHGHSVDESPCVAGRSVIGRVSVADASLSLSLSLSGRAGSPLTAGQAAGFADRQGRLGHSRALGAPAALCSPAVADLLSVAVLPCPRSRGSFRVDRSLRRGWVL